MTHQVLLSTLSNEMENHDDFRIFWFGSHQYVPKELNNLTVNLKIYHDFDECETDIKSIKSDRSILFVFTDFFDYMLYLDQYQQIHSIYVLNVNHQQIGYTKDDCSKLAYIFVDENILIKRLRQDILLTYRNDLPIMISSLKDIDNQLSLICFNTNEILFYWNQLFNYTLVHEDDIDMQQLKQEMIQQCRFECYDETDQLQKIDDFQNTCTPENILTWYTRASCIFQLVNKAFRTRNIDLIYKFRYFIILLYNKLKQLSNEQRTNHSLTVYRGQKIGTIEREMLKKNKGCLISTNTIMSTTADKGAAEMFLTPKDSVLFEINIENRNQDSVCTFADISHLSLIPDEKEILFFSGAIFRIEDISETNNGTPVFKFTLTSETTEYLEQLMNILQKRLAYAVRYGDVSEKTNDFSLFNRYHKYLSNGTYSAVDIAKLFIYIDDTYLLNNFDKPKKLIEYYEQLLRNQNFIDHSKRIVLNILIGKNYFHLKQYDTALSQYNTALALLNYQDRLTGDIYDHLGDVWQETNDYQSALLCYEQALQIISRHDPKDKQIPRICRKLADINKKLGNLQHAHQYENQAEDFDKYYERLRSSVRSTIAKHHEEANVNIDVHKVEYIVKLYRTGMHLVRQGQFLEGLDNLLKAEELIKNDVCLYDHFVHQLAKLYEHAAFAYLCLNKRLQALIIWRKAIDIRANFKIY